MEEGALSMYPKEPWKSVEKDCQAVYRSCLLPHSRTTESCPALIIPRLVKGRSAVPESKDSADNGYFPKPPPQTPAFA